jgi:hypothetical protein
MKPQLFPDTVSVDINSAFAHHVRLQDATPSGGARGKWRRQRKTQSPALVRSKALSAATADLS